MDREAGIANTLASAGICGKRRVLLTYSKSVDDCNKPNPGPRIFYLDARHAGPISGWDEWLVRAQSLGCDWLWLGEFQARMADAHPFAVDDPGRLARELMPKGKAQLARFIANAREAGMRLATDFAPAAATLAICDFAGSARAELEKYWSDVAKTLLGYGFDALICRAAQRLTAESWMNVLAAARRERGAAVFWADTLGAPIETSEGLAPVGFDAFFSSACWWDFHADWFVEQEARLRRMAPTIAFAEAFPASSESAVQETDRGRARLRYGFAATAAWGVVLPMEYAAGSGQASPSVPLPAEGGSVVGVFPAEAGSVVRVLPAEGGSITPFGTKGVVPPLEEEAGRGDACRNSDFELAIAAVNAMKRATPAFDAPSRLERLSAPGARAVVLAARPVTSDAPPALIALNPDPAMHAEADAGPLFARLDASVAAARELTSGRSPERLDAASTLALEPENLRWFELVPLPTTTVKAPIEVPAQFADSIAIENLAPQIDAGRHAVKRVLGEAIEVFADLIAEGHARPAAALRYRVRGEEAWCEAPFLFFDNDRWRGRFVPERIGGWEFQVLAWRDRYGEWREDAIKRRDAGQPLGPELGEGEALLAEAIAAADARTQARLAGIRNLLGEHADDVEARADLLLAETTIELIEAALPRTGLGTSPIFPVLVERGRARTGAWYECFPRSLGAADCHGTFGDLIRHLPYIVGLGFDVLYLPPIHPIGVSHRKGKNNALAAGADDPGSPWAIGAKEGGHTAIHPELGTLADFRRLLAAARREGLDIALDFAIQCSRDHPWVREHPEWFRWRPDGSIRYAENPPKKYQDIVNVDFFCEDREALWRALVEVLLFWCGEGVRIFRVDNPHTKPLAFWEWALGVVRARYPDTIFLAEAFTRPKPMHRLAKIGFSQSYTYFTWRETKAELGAYMIELTSGDGPEYFRPNFWVNTPDINPLHLQQNGRAGFVIRAVLAATLAPSWGMYSGYELCEAEPLRDADGTAREEYLDAEKYELKHRDFAAPGNIGAEIAALNRIRRENPAFAELANLDFHPAYNDQVMFYSRRAPDNLIWVLVSLDPHAAQEAELELPLDALDADEGTPLAVEELLRGERWLWRGRRQRVRLDPARPAMILRVSEG